MIGATTAARVLGPTDGKAGFLGSIGVRFMIDGDETGGGFSLVEHPMSPRALAAPLHRHTREDEYSFVLEGRVGALLGDEVVIGGPGDLIFKPRASVAHVLERRRRAGSPARDHRPCGLRAVLCGARRARRLCRSGSAEPGGAGGPLRPRGTAGQHPRAARALRASPGGAAVAVTRAGASARRRRRRPGASTAAPARRGGRRAATTVLPRGGIASSPRTTTATIALRGSPSSRTAEPAIAWSSATAKSTDRAC